VSPASETLLSTIPCTACGRLPPVCWVADTLIEPGRPLRRRAVEYDQERYEMVWSGKGPSSAVRDGATQAHTTVGAKTRRHA